jgi:hypothetical protein
MAKSMFNPLRPDLITRRHHRLAAAVLAAVTVVGLAACQGDSPRAAPVSSAASVPAVWLAAPATLLAERTRYRGGDPRTGSAVTALLARADHDLAVTPVSVTTKTQLPPSGDRHDYLSLSVYAWPDPSRPDGRPYVIRDGQRNPSIADVPDKAGLNDVIDWSQELAYAYFFSGDAAYATKAAAVLRTWFLAPGTRMNPNLNYAQGVPGASTGQPGGIIDTADLPLVLDAADLLAGSSAWTAADQSGLQAWVGDLLAWLRTSAAGRAEAGATNNHATWFAGQVIDYALFTGDTALARSLARQSESTVIAAQITATGRQPLELARADTWSYSTYNLDALSRLARLAASVQVDLWNYTAPNGASIRKALDYLAPYADHLADWPETQSRTRTDQYLVEPLFAAAAAYHDPAYASAATAAAATLPARYPAWSLLLPSAG